MPLLRRHALLLGAVGYSKPLAGPEEDVRRMRDSLMRAGFGVRCFIDKAEGRKGQMEANWQTAIDAYKAAVKRDHDHGHPSLCVVYLSGHGEFSPSKGHQLKLPAQRRGVLEDPHISLEDDILRDVAQWADIVISVFDACRTNSHNHFSCSSVRYPGSADASWLKGARATLLMCWACPQGKTAENALNAWDHSPFTGALLRHLFKPGTAVHTALKQAKVDIRTRGLGEAAQLLTPCSSSRPTSFPSSPFSSSPSSSFTFSTHTDSSGSTPDSFSSGSEVPAVHATVGCKDVAFCPPPLKQLPEPQLELVIPSGLQPVPGGMQPGAGSCRVLQLETAGRDELEAVDFCLADQTYLLDGTDTVWAAANWFRWSMEALQQLNPGKDLAHTGSKYINVPAPSTATSSAPPGHHPPASSGYNPMPPTAAYPPPSTPAYWPLPANYPPAPAYPPASQPPSYPPLQHGYPPAPPHHSYQPAPAYHAGYQPTPSAYPVVPPAAVPGYTLPPPGYLPPLPSYHASSSSPGCVIM